MSFPLESGCKSRGFMNNSQTFSKVFLKFFLSFIQMHWLSDMFNSMFFRNTVKRRGKYTFIIYKRMETGGEMREERSGKYEKNNLKTDWKPYLDPYKRHWQKPRHLQYGGVQNCRHRWPSLHRISPYRQWRLAHCSCRIFHLSNGGILFQVRERTAGRRRGWTCHEKGHSWNRGFLNGKIFMPLAEIGDIIPTFDPLWRLQLLCRIYTRNYVPSNVHGAGLLFHDIS